MDPVYVFGHKNPDTDSIVAAIAYASLRNALGDREYVACRLGVLSDETSRILQRFGFESPMRLHDVRTQVKDLSFDRPPILSDAVTVHKAWELMNESDLPSASLPIANEEGKLFGMLTSGDIAQYDLRFVEETLLQDVPLFNLLSCLDGQIWGDYGDVTGLSGELCIAVPGMPQAFPEHGIVITGRDSAVLKAAYAAGATAVIVCGGQLQPEDMPDRGTTVIITTPYDRPNRKKVVLVDHSETAQSVDGLGEAQILAIIDHHRLADVETVDPIYVRTEAVGASTTIIATMFQERGIMPGQKLAGLMAAGILSDTILFQSPTCTDRDKIMAERMARLAGLSLTELGKDIFSSTLPADADVKELLFTDFKQFQIAGHSLGIGQFTSTDCEQLVSRHDEVIAIMEEERNKRGYEMLLFMLTDVLKRSTRLLAVGDLNELGQVFNVKFKDNAATLPGVMSRKKQIVPTLSLIWG